MKTRAKLLAGILVTLFLLTSVFAISLPAAALAEGWEIINPTVPSCSINAIWTSSSGEIFAAGNSGRIMHYDGTDWTRTSTGSGHLYGVWGNSESDVFVVGKSGFITHYDGSDWTEMTSGTTEELNGVWGSAADDVYAVSKCPYGGSGVILHYDGDDWSTMASTDKTLYAVWGNAANDIFVAGEKGTILHYDGTDWSAMDSGITGSTYLYDMWGSSSSDVFAVGSSGTILHYDGSAWTAMTSGSSTSLKGVWGSGPTDVYVSGYSATILHYDGTDWSPMDSGVTSINLLGIWGNGASDVFAAGPNTTVLHYDGSAWSTMLSLDFNLTSNQLNDIQLIGSEVFAVGNVGTVVHYDGASWSVMDCGGTTTSFTDVWASSPTDVYAVVGSSPLHYDGTAWSTVDTGISVNDIWGSGASDIFVVGQNGAIAYYNGTDWSAMTCPNTVTTLTAVWGSSATDVFAGNLIGEIFHYDGNVEGNWTAMTSGTPNEIAEFWGSGPDDVFAVGEDGTILHYDGNAEGDWMAMTSGTSEDLDAIWGSNAGDIFAVSGSGTVLHYDGSAWSDVDAGLTGLPLFGVCGDGLGNLYVCGASGYILTYQYGSAPVADDQSVTTPFNTDIAITLTASDDDGDPLDYMVIDEPSHGTLSGTAPELTYTPAEGYSGADSFTFQAYDGLLYSNLATVSITVNPSSPYAVEVVDYSGVFGTAPYYNDPQAVLGKPTTQCQNIWGSASTLRVKLVEPAYLVDLDGNNVITTINSGDYIIVRFDHQVTDDPDNPYGIDLLVFGNAFFVGYGSVSDATNMDEYMLANPSAIFEEPVTVAVSQDGENWYEFSSGPCADSLFPTQAYEWDSDSHSWTDNEMDFTLPVNPSLTLSDFDGFSAAQAIAMYNGSGGGTGYDLAETPYSWIQYVRVTGSNPPGEIDAFADVAPGAPAVTVDLRASGVAGDIINVNGYSVPAGSVTEDGFVIDNQTAMGALIYYCQQNSIEVTVTENEYGLYVYQIGTDASDEDSWMYYVDGSSPWSSGDQYALTSGEEVHWVNYLLGLYSLSLSLDVTDIEPGDNVTATVSYTDGNGTSAAAELAEVYVSSTTDSYGYPATPGTGVGQTNASGQCTFVWNDEGTFYPYAEWNGKDTIYQWPVASFSCTGGTTPPWDINDDGVVDIADIVLVGTHFGEEGEPGWIPEDINDDGVIDVSDLVLIGAHFD